MCEPFYKNVHQKKWGNSKTLEIYDISNLRLTGYTKVNYRKAKQHKNKLLTFSGSLFRQVSTNSLKFREKFPKTNKNN